MEKRERLVALFGHPNSGKSTLFNQLTGLKQEIGNWPGVTVEKKEGIIDYNGKKARLIDLPGALSLSPFTIDEKIARNFILENDCRVVVIVDASNIRKNLYILLEVLELGADTILVLNKMDRVKKEEKEIDIKLLEKVFGIPVIPIIARNGTNIEKLREEIFSKNINKAKFKIDYGEHLDDHIDFLEKIIPKIEGFSNRKRWLAIKALEEDPSVSTLFPIQFQQALEHQKRHIRKFLKTDIPTYIIERRYSFLEGLSREAVKIKGKKANVSNKIDAILTNHILGVPILFTALAAIFFITFKLGTPVSSFFSLLFDKLAIFLNNLLTSLGINSYIISFINDGVIGGVGTVISFFPVIFIMFFLIAFVEDSGYMARGAYVMDRFMHLAGLHGKSFIPVVMGFGCNVPAILSTRIIEDRKDRLITILTNPFIPCSARLAVFTIFITAFFPRNGWILLIVLYILGIFVAFFSAIFLRRSFFKGQKSELIMELPDYNMPSFKIIFLHSWEHSKEFLKRAGTIIFAGALIVWLLASLPVGVEYASKASILGHIGSFFAPLFKPNGFGFYQAVVALLLGVVAKELVIATLGTLLGAQAGNIATALHTYFTTLSAISFLVMTLLYLPCLATLSAIKTETQSYKWAIFSLLYSISVAYILSFIVYRIGMLII